MHILTGEYRHALDAKGRLCIPSRLLKVLGEPIYVFKGPEHCLNVFAADAWEELAGRLRDLPPTHARKLRRELFSSALECVPDGQGRILLSPKLREYAGIKTDAVIAGAEKYAEIWAAAAWDGRDEDESYGSLETAMDLIGL